MTARASFASSSTASLTDTDPGSTTPAYTPKLAPRPEDGVLGRPRYPVMRRKRLQVDGAGVRSRVVAAHRWTGRPLGARGPDADEAVLPGVLDVGCAARELDEHAEPPGVDRGAPGLGRQPLTDGRPSRSRAGRRTPQPGSQQPDRCRAGRRRARPRRGPRRCRRGPSATPTGPRRRVPPPGPALVQQRSPRRTLQDVALRVVDGPQAVERRVAGAALQRSRLVDEEEPTVSRDALAREEIVCGWCRDRPFTGVVESRSTLISVGHGCTADHIRGESRP